MNKIVEICKTIRVNLVSYESDLVKQLEDKLLNSGFKFKKEFRLGRGCRVDFFLSNGIAIEVKKGKPNCTLVKKQIQKYLQDDRVKGLILVTERGLMHQIHESNGKPVKYVAMSKNWGIAL